MKDEKTKQKLDKTDWKKTLEFCEARHMKKKPTAQKRNRIENENHSADTEPKQETKKKKIFAENEVKKTGQLNTKELRKIWFVQNAARKNVNDFANAKK